MTGVDVFVGTINGVLVNGTNGVLLGTVVAVATIGVALLTPMITGVGECIEGVLVGGRNGVGGLYGDGWKNQPLHDVSRNIARLMTVIFFISSPPHDCTPHAT